MRMDKLAVAVSGLCAASLLLGAPIAQAAHQHLLAQSKSMTLQGTVTATETHLMSNPDVGALYKWNGKGAVRPLGTVSTGKGSNHGVGFVQQGSPTGAATLSNGSGSITLKITYDRTRGFSPLPVHGTYVITGGTGRYVGARGNGTVLRKQGACPNGGSCRIGVPFSVTYQFSGPSAKKGKKHH